MMGADGGLSEIKKGFSKIEMRGRVKWKTLQHFPTKALQIYEMERAYEMKRTWTRWKVKWK